MCGYMSDNTLSRLDLEGKTILIDRGLIDASTFPLFPEARKGDVFTVSEDGVIGDSDNGSGIRVTKGDVIRSLVDTPEGDAFFVARNWNTLQSKIDQDQLDDLLNGLNGTGPIFPFP